MQEIVRKQIEGLKYLRVGNGGAVVSNPKTGEILAMVGSKDYFNTPDQGNVNVTTSQRQPGSAIKVVNYAAALENGFTASTVIDDSPITYQIAGSIPYSPVNYDSKFHGATPFRYALGNSYNIPAVKILAKIGLKTMIEKGRLMGIESWEDESRYGLSLTLGGGEVTMIEMAKVFGTLANQGRRHDILPILEVTDYTGKVIERNVPGNGVKALTPETAWIMGNILADNNARTAAFGPSSSLVIPGKTVSVKTGTSNDKRDNWTVGYTPSIVTTVWVGNNDNSPMDPYLTSGITGAAPIWHDIMVELLKDKQDEVPLRPDTIISLPCYFDRPGITSAVLSQPVADVPHFRRPPHPRRRHLEISCFVTLLMRYFVMREHKKPSITEGSLVFLPHNKITVNVVTIFIVTHSLTTTLPKSDGFI